MLTVKEQLEKILLDMNLLPEHKLKRISLEFIQFCLLNRNMYMIFFNTKATRVDEQAPELEINQLRIEIFGLLKRGLQECLQIRENNDAVLTYARIYYFTLQGIVGTYTLSEEPLKVLMERVLPTFEETVDVLLLGFKQKLRLGDDMQ